MITNYLKIAFRNMVRHKGYSAINILGLAIGIACCLVIVLFVMDELSYDRYHQNADRTYRVTREFMDANGTTSLHLGHVAPPFGPLIKKEFPQVQQTVRFYMFGNPLLIFKDKQFVEDKFVFAEKDVFKIFSFPLIEGDSDTALTEPGCIVITHQMAEKYFGQEDALGKTIIFRPNPGMGIPDVPLKVTGILKKIPANSHFTFDFLCSFVTYEQVAGDREMQSWGSNNYATYLLLPKGTKGMDLEKLFPAFLDRNLPEHRGHKPHEWTRLNLQALTKIHLYSHLDSEIEANGNIVFVYIFFAIAFLVLLIACINFMNLSTARSARRAREVGIRKVVGSGKKQLRIQFLGESLVMVAISMILSLIIVYLTLPYFNRFVGKELDLNIFGNLLLLPGLLATLIVVGLIAGSYPALYLSQIPPIKVLKGVTIQTGKSFFRNILVIFQFTVSIALIICLGVIRSQLDYARNKPLGFKKDRVIVLPATRDMINNLESIKHRLKQNPGILYVSAAKRVPSGRLLDSSGAKIYNDGKAMPVGFRIANLRVDHDFFTTFGIDIAAGRFFSKDIATDSQQAFIVNEATVRQLGWQSAQEAIDKRIDYGSRKGRIVGVVKDFHFESIHQKIAPMIFYINPRSFSQISLRLTPQRIPEALKFLRNQWKTFRPGYPFDYYFIDENFDRQYQTEEKLGHILGIFSILAIFIACLGLLGLASYTAERRIKEISIRKVLGAHLSGIIWLFTKDFGRWVIMANLMAWPLSYYFMSKWLDKFAYSTHLNLGLFLLASGICLFIALLTVSYQAIKAATAKPVDALKYE